MKVVFLQDTINYMHKLDPASLPALEQKHGIPEVKDIISKDGEQIRYYIYTEDENKTQES